MNDDPLSSKKLSSKKRKKSETMSGLMTYINAAVDVMQAQFAFN